MSQNYLIINNMNDRWRLAIQGRTWSQGGLNMEDLKNICSRYKCNGLTRKQLIDAVAHLIKIQKQIIVPERYVDTAEIENIPLTSRGQQFSITKTQAHIYHQIADTYWNIEMYLNELLSKGQNIHFADDILFKRIFDNDHYVAKYFIKYEVTPTIIDYALTRTFNDEEFLEWMTLLWRHTNARFYILTRFKHDVRVRPFLDLYLDDIIKLNIEKIKLLNKRKINVFENKHLAYYIFKHAIYEDTPVEIRIQLSDEEYDTRIQDMFRKYILN